MKTMLLTGFIMLFVLQTNAQSSELWVDSIQRRYHIPELAFAVISADTIYAMHASGVKRINTNYIASLNDRFHIGSNTKAITSYIAAMLVQQNKISWNTKFFELFPALKSRSQTVYYNITLQDLLTFRAMIPAYTYSNNKPTKKEIKGNDEQQRLLLAKYFLLQSPMQFQNGLTPSNADYILAGLMLEKASGKSYKELVKQLGDTLKADFDFDYPNLKDTLQTWGHDEYLKPVAPAGNYKLNWLLFAGNINVSLPDYIKFIQEQLKGLKGKSSLLTQKTYNKLLFGLPVFSFGWFNKTDPATQYHIAFNEGNAGAFITRVEISKESGKAYILFANAATTSTEEGMQIIMKRLQSKYEIFSQF